jgi:hypothetical protein
VFFSGTFDPIALQAANPNTYRPDPRFGQADQWQQRREMRLQIRYSFWTSPALAPRQEARGRGGVCLPCRPSLACYTEKSVFTRKSR